MGRGGAEKKLDQRGDAATVDAKQGRSKGSVFPGVVSRRHTPPPHHSHSFFQMLQHPRLNKRFIYVLLETLLLRLFPAPNNFVELFARLHAASADPTKQRAAPKA